jgi:hypothetical protein
LAHQLCQHKHLRGRNFERRAWYFADEPLARFSDALLKTPKPSTANA